MEPGPSTLIGDAWRLDAKLGEGGLAAVYAATHVRTGGRVAIKLLHAHLAGDADVCARLAREGYAANAIQHPGAVRVLGDGIHEGRAYLVLELVDGESLKSRWTRAGRRLPLDEVARIVGELLDILAAAHAAGVVHRDIKPDNILLDRRGGVRLVDFGIARVAQGSRFGGATMTGALLGTPAFMAPEQALSRWGEVDARTDLFAVAATAFTLLSGRLVHPGSAVPEILIAAATKPAAPVRSALPEVPEPIAAVLDGALQFERDRRPRDARTMRDAWMQAVSASTRSAPVGPTRIDGPPSPTAIAASPPAPTIAPHVTPAPTSKRRRWPLVVAVLSALVIAGGVTTAILVWPSAPPRKPRKTAASSTASPASSPTPSAIASAGTPPPTASTATAPENDPTPKNVEELARLAIAKFGASAVVVELNWNEQSSAVQLLTREPDGGEVYRPYLWNRFTHELVPVQTSEAIGHPDRLVLSTLDLAKVAAIQADALARTRLKFSDPARVWQARLIPDAREKWTLDVGVMVVDRRLNYRYAADGRQL